MTPDPPATTPGAPPITPGQPTAPRRRSWRWRLGIIVGLAAVFAASAGAGVVATYPGGLAALTGTAASPTAGPGDTSGPSPAAAASADPGGSPVATPSGGTSPSPSDPWASASPGGSAAPSGSPGASTFPGASASPSAQPTETPAPAQLAAKLQRALERARVKYGIPGVQATITWPDGRTWTGVAGLADTNPKVRVAPDTPFGIGSVTKTFTAALILRLAERGRLSIDDRLSRWLPGFPNARNITLRMLLQHTSGIMDYFASGALDRAMLKDRRRVFTPTEILGYVKGAYFAPGTSWAYSNTNYLLLGLVAEKVAGKSWATQIREEFLDPLGLRSTYVQRVEPAPARTAHGFRFFGTAVTGVPRDQTDGTNVSPFTSVVTAAWSAGQMASTSGDLARWARALYTGDVLAPASRRAMLDVSRTVKLRAKVAYGLGASRVKLANRFVVYGHTGALAGVRAAIRWYPKEDLVIAVTFNRDGFTGDHVVRSLLEALYPLPKPSPSPSPTARP